MNAFLEAAMQEARQSRREGGIPIGSVIVHKGRILGRGHNRRVRQGNAILHGEMGALIRRSTENRPGIGVKRFERLGLAGTTVCNRFPCMW